MKNHISTFALLLPLALAGVGSALAAEDDAATDAAPAKCSQATLHGTYLFAYQGFTVSGNDQGPFAAAGSEVFDGLGNVRSVSTFSVNGKITQLARIDGRYTVNADCTGSTIYSDGTRYDDFIAPDGSIHVFVQTNPGTVAAAFEPRATAHRVGD
jgi:hypothetical protein